MIGRTQRLCVSIDSRAAGCCSLPQGRRSSSLTLLSSRVQRVAEKSPRRPRPDFNTNTNTTHSDPHRLPLLNSEQSTSSASTAGFPLPNLSSVGQRGLISSHFPRVLLHRFLTVAPLTSNHQAYKKHVSQLLFPCFLHSSFIRIGPSTCSLLSDHALLRLEHPARTAHTATASMARSKKRAEPLSDSSLSPPPDELSAQAETTTIVVVGNGKRKANNTAAPQVTKRTKVSTAVKVEDNEVPTSIAPTPKGRTAKKVEVEKAREAEPDDEDVKPLKATRKRVKSQQTVGDTVDHSENGDEDSKPKKAPRKKKDTNSAPLADRTTDTNLRVGAHVSIAGG